MPAAFRSFHATALAVAVSLAVVAPAAAQPGAQARNIDPYESFNRKAFAINQTLDRNVLRPVALAWKRVVPSVVREGLRNAFSNLGEPVVFINDMIQGRADEGSVTLQRFLINSTAGIAGIADVAKAHKLPHHSNGFATTLGRAGVGPGPYIYLIGLGPSTGRDLFGSGVDTLTSPQTWIGYGARTEVGIAQAVAGGLNARADADSELETIQAQATDPYATLRSLYLQNRQADIRGQQVDVEALPSFDDPAAAGQPAAAGSRSPTGAPPRKDQGPTVPQGDASALPRPAPTAPPSTESPD